MRCAKLCVAKLAGRIDGSTRPAAFADLLLREGATPEDDEFVEVHVGGPMTVRTLARVLVKPGARRTVIGKALQAKLEKFGVSLEGRSWKP